MRIAVGNSLVEERNSGLVEVVALALSEGRERLGFTPRVALADADDLDDEADPDPVDAADEDDGPELHRAPTPARARA